ncbi:butyrophilin subfamily 3 member A1-like isoform X2 [Myotis daubentonii]|uniref:butyrophilin subfamily 3 member A1-like isoform X2 n=1 Tax=Myotis daubentonii TaxID=98922 RepID=UPI00287389AA|nr:butyrophilin subfamily 3 member A1-like isoform X2 [Myotis daubentonii]
MRQHTYTTVEEWINITLSDSRGFPIHMSVGHLYLFSRSSFLPAPSGVSLSAQQPTMVRSLAFHRLHLPVCLALVQLLNPCSAQVAVIGPPEPILAMVGEDAELLCHLSPKMSAESMELMWRRFGLRQVVRAYAHGKEETEIAEYQGRTSILREDITEGKVVLRIHKVRASDSGTYQCYFQDDDFLAKAQVELKVAALGSDLHIEMKDNEDGGIRVECTSAGWYPQPLVEWRGDGGESLPAMAAPGTVDGEGLYAVTSSVILKGSSGKGVFCVFRNPLLSQEKTARVSIAGPFFSSTKPWQVAFCMTLVALLGLLAGLVISWWQQQKRIRALSQEKERERAEKEAALAAKEHEQAEKEAAWMKEQLERCTKGEAWLQVGWRKKQYLEHWKMALYQPADVILDPDTAHPSLLISDDQRSLNCTLERQSLPDNPKRFQDRYCVLGCESFTSGRHFWEVEVGDRKQWHLGVCRENVERKYYATISPENGFWTIALSGGHEFQARTDPRTKLTIANPLKRVGVFLDCEMREVSFYDAINGSHIFTFQQASFSGPLWPFFRIWSHESTALTACPAPKGVRSSLVSDPLPGPSLETPVASGSANGNEDPQEEVISLLPSPQH